MATAAPRRNTARRDRYRRSVAQGRPPCHLCGEDIDYDAPHLDPLSFQIDHVIPLAKGGRDVLENLAASHRKCNRAKADGPAVARAAVSFVTHRRW